MFLQILEDVQDLGLDRNVQRTGRLVADQEAGLRGECARDRDPLPLTARELVRVFQRRLSPQTDLIEQLRDAGFDGLTFHQVVMTDRFRPRCHPPACAD